MKRGFLNKNFILISAAITLCLIVLLTCFSDTLYAKFSTTASDGDSARVAKFEVVTTGWCTSPVMAVEDIHPGSTFERKVKVENKSEVKITYNLTFVNNYESLPLVMTVKDSSGKDVTEVSGELAVGETSPEYSVKVEWITEKGDRDIDPKDYVYEGKLDCITAVVRAIQVD